MQMAETTGSRNYLGVMGSNHFIIIVRAKDACALFVVCAGREGVTALTASSSIYVILRVDYWLREHWIMMQRAQLYNYDEGYEENLECEGLTDHTVVPCDIFALSH